MRPARRPIRSEHIPSGLLQKADIIDAFRHFRFVPFPDSRTAANNARGLASISLSAGEQRRRDFKAERFAVCGLITSTY
jgi:hypothetical protein